MPNTEVYLDVAIGKKAGGRIVFQLFTDITPRTAENFRGLCTGEYGLAQKSKKPLHYVGCKFFRILPGFIIQSGDFVSNSGDGGESVYSGPFRDENFTRRHAQAGVLSMENNGPHSNTSQFFITLKQSPQLDGKHVVFGQVSQGMEVIRAIEKVPVDSSDRPRVPILIVGSGELGDSSSRQIDSFAEFRENWGSKTSAENAKSAAAKGEAQLNHVLHEANIEAAKRRAGLLEENNGYATILGPQREEKKPEPSDERSRKLAALREQMNQSRQSNNKEVIEERKRWRDPKYEQKQASKDPATGDDGAGDGKVGYAETAAQVAEAQAKKKNSGDGQFGWSVFNQDSLYRAHKKRLNQLTFEKDDYKRQKEQMGDAFYSVDNAGALIAEKPSEQAKERLAQSVSKEVESRKNFSRRRTFVDEEDISYINERNRHYNKKLDRAFGQYSLEIKQNLERGTAL